MINKMIVREALRSSWELKYNSAIAGDSPADGQDSVISLLIHDIFGGEILKTHKKQGWHFYNRIDGERIDFTKIEMDKLPDERNFEDIPSTPDETYSYFAREDYSAFLMKFIKAFEESVGLNNFWSGLTA